MAASDVMQELEVMATAGVPAGQCMCGRRPSTRTQSSGVQEMIQHLAQMVYSAAYRLQGPMMRTP